MYLSLNPASDTNGDGLLDQVEIEALFQNEVGNSYSFQKGRIVVF